MKLRSDVDSWICSRMEKVMLHKNIEIRSNWRSVANEGEEYGSWGWSSWFEKGRISRDGLQVICTLIKERLKNQRSIYSDLI